MRIGRREYAMCAGKVRYRSKAAAVKAGRFLMARQGAVGICAYGPCSYCGGWHVGNYNYLREDNQVWSLKGS